MHGPEDCQYEHSTSEVTTASMIVTTDMGYGEGVRESPDIAGGHAVWPCLYTDHCVCNPLPLLDPCWCRLDNPLPDVLVPTIALNQSTLSPPLGTNITPRSLMNLNLQRVWATSEHVLHLNISEIHGEKSIERLIAAIWSIKGSFTGASKSHHLPLPDYVTYRHLCTAGGLQQQHSNVGRRPARRATPP